MTRTIQTRKWIWFDVPVGVILLVKPSVGCPVDMTIHRIRDIQRVGWVFHLGLSSTASSSNMQSSTSDLVLTVVPMDIRRRQEADTQIYRVGRPEPSSKAASET
jgi:hypothetical protein